MTRRKSTASGWPSLTSAEATAIVTGKQAVVRSEERPKKNWAASEAPAGAAIEIGPDPDGGPNVPRDIYFNGSSITDTGVGVLIDGGENIQFNGGRIDAETGIVARDASVKVRGTHFRQNRTSIRATDSDLDLDSPNIA